MANGNADLFCKTRQHGTGLIVARVPYGYKQQGSGLVIDAEQAAIVQRIFQEFTRAYIRAGLTEIAEGLTVDEVPTQRGRKWHASTIKYLLANQVYAEQPGAIVSREVYDRAQSRLASMRHGPTR